MLKKLELSYLTEQGYAKKVLVGTNCFFVYPIDHYF